KQHAPLVHALALMQNLKSEKIKPGQTWKVFSLASFETVFWFHSTVMTGFSGLQTWRNSSVPSVA
ncbi:MAG: hypothetical protein WB384_24715, partial [Candidatus Sulfotelmatobacter sp.]